ncbi:hypothetical protein RZS08_03065, partial [Arthrospira platensis SPKY1]|nr:hypothetical protein [Arthrospira platensis SPKY1]
RKSGLPVDATAEIAGGNPFFTTLFPIHPIDPEKWFKKASMTKDALLHLIEKTLQPETDLERQLILHPEFREGLLWGVPRYGHPEGEIYKHIREVLDNIERLPIGLNIRRKL